ncbi:MAG: hypothetical protein CME36_03200 [unclassified Hahellaceae]|nr:hypothetical protein [Hahellaceae bacterium]
MSSKVVSSTRRCLLAGSIAAVCFMLLFRLAASVPTKVESAASAGMIRHDAGGSAVSKGNAVAGVELLDTIAPGPLPASLQGAEPELELITDAEGHLVPDYDLMVLFDFYLGALEEEPLETVLARLHLALAAQLEGQALAEAKDLLGRYVDYRIGLAELETQATLSADGSFDADNLQARLQSIQALRASLFDGEELQAFFQLDEVQDQFVVQQLAISYDTTLSPGERSEALAALEQQLPQPIRELRQQVHQNADLYSKAEAMREAGASAEAIFQERAAVHGEAIAADLAKLDEERAQWRARIDAYAVERQRLLQSGLSAADQQAAIDALRAGRFSELEQLEVRAFESEL